MKLKSAIMLVVCFAALMAAAGVRERDTPTIASVVPTNLWTPG
jgi:hypothetical protein